MNTSIHSNRENQRVAPYGTSQRNTKKQFAKSPENTPVKPSFSDNTNSSKQSCPNGRCGKESPKAESEKKIKNIAQAIKILLNLLKKSRALSKGKTADQPEDQTQNTASTPSSNTDKTNTSKQARINDNSKTGLKNQNDDFEKAIGFIVGSLIKKGMAEEGKLKTNPA